MKVIDAPAVEYWLDKHLQAWADWMHGKELPDGLPTDSCAGIVQNYTTLDWDGEAYDNLDNDIAIRTNAVIDDVGQRHPAQKAAIYRKYSIHAVYRFPRENYWKLLQEARANVLIGLRKRGVWCGE